MQKLRFTAFAPRHDLVGSHRDGPDILVLTVVFADLVLADGCLIQQLGQPLPGCRHISRKDQSGGLELRHAGHSHNGLARSARKCNGPGTAARAAPGVKSPSRINLISAKSERLTPQSGIAQ